MTEPAQTSPLLRMRGISKSFPGVRALESVDFEVGEAEIHAFLGENGAGKSTLLKILSGAQPPDDGHASNSRAARQLRLARRRRSGPASSPSTRNSPSLPT